MDPQQSPPKRMTRARAAAKVGEPSTMKTTKIVTAAAKARTTRTTSTAAKRKLRSDDVDDNDDESHDELDAQQPQEPTTKAPRARGRPRKMDSAASESKDVVVPAPRPRGRPPKKAAPEPVNEAPAAARSTRASRAKKADPDEDQVEVLPEPVRKVGRPRTATATKPAVKKRVTFEEPEKENIVPQTAAKAKVAGKASDTSTGMRAKPTRRVAAVSRPTRSRSGTTGEPQDAIAVVPLSPRKVTQIRQPRDTAESDDELAAVDRPSIKPMMRSPIKPAPNLHGAIKSGESATETAPEGTILNAPALPTIILGSPARRPPPSPYKDAMKSPAKRGELPSVSVGTANGESRAGSVNLKASLLQSPAKRPPVPINGLESHSIRDDTIRSPFKISLLQSPAKRGPLPSKIQPSPQRQDRSPAPKSTLLATPATASLGILQGEEGSEDEDLGVHLGEMEEDAMLKSPTRLRFPGRLSAVIPRHADPSFKDSMMTVPETSEVDSKASLGQECVDAAQDLGDPMEVDEADAGVEAASRVSTTPPQSPPKRTMAMFSLRQRDLNPYEDLESESEDELGRSFQGAYVPSTPCPASSSRTPRSALPQDQSLGRSTRKRNQFGFTPLAEQFSSWRAASPQKQASRDALEQPLGTHDDCDVHEDGKISPTVVEPTLRTTFFEDAMSAQPHIVIQDASEAATGSTDGSDLDNDVETPVFEEIPVTQEDVALAAEADEMSVMEPAQLEEVIGSQGLDDSMSETSQEYGDENAIPIDPALFPPGESLQIPPVTPQRMLTRTFHTVSKVPLKPADESTPRPVKKRSHSISRLPTSVQRPNRGLTRNATVISYSPSKKDRQQATFDDAALQIGEEEQSRGGSEPPVTPSKSEPSWSTVGTPAQTPRRDVDPALLRGAVVFVDVHTTEGADASGIFVELLSQMGARCVKSWSWNPSSPPGKDGAASKIGITHVVYKDGGKRTMEKVRESGGVVQCVGVSWVLDCERENLWLDEAPYYIDTSLVPRGGARRRKSMEPKALANLNAMVMSTPAENGNNPRESHTAPSTPANRRRDSGLWVRTPENDDAPHDEPSEWDLVRVLTPVPKTPAPEAVAQFAANIAPATPSDFGDDAAEADREALLMRTCPPKASVYAGLGEGILAPEKDPAVLQRLMAARRKSLQYAPKVGSPLARTWN